MPHGGCVFLMQLCDFISKTSKVVLTGEGADEFFGGYERYGNWKKLQWQERLGRWLPSSIIPDQRPFKGIKRFSGRDAAVGASVYGDTRVLWDIFPALASGKGARDEASGRFQDFRSRLLAVDQSAYLESLLVRQDKMSMAASVESRVPFVHLPLVREVNALAHSLRIPGGETKPILKQIAERYLPRDLLYRRKVGLTLPYAAWCDNPKTLGRYLEFLESPSSRLSTYSSTGALKSAVERFRAGSKPERRYMFRLINIELWLRSLEIDQREFNPSSN